MDLKNEWTKKGNKLMPYDREDLLGKGFKPETVSFLAEVGLPDKCAPNLEFQSECYDDATYPFSYSDYFDDPDPIYAGCYVIGIWNILGESPICVDVNFEDRIITIYDDGWIGGMSDSGSSREYIINNSVAQLTDSILVYDRFFETYSFEKESLQKLDLLKNELKDIDSAYNEPNSFWKNELEVRLIKILAANKK